MRKRVGGSFISGKAPVGCKLCAKGAKIVLFVTGVCNDVCYYCPLSEKRKGKDIPWANERVLEHDDDLLLEAKRTASKGAGITGGNPLLRLDRTVHYIQLLKEQFGSSYHLHLYTSEKGVKPEMLKKVHNAGLDEIRFHYGKEIIKKALKLDWDVGAEIPAIPGDEEKIKAFLTFLSTNGATFLNLNELEFSCTNLDSLTAKGFVCAEDAHRAQDSREAAQKIIRWAEEELGTDMTLHFCSSSYKDSVQLTQRFIRTAKNIARPFEKIVEDGLIRKGVIYSTDVSLLKNINKRYFALDQEKKRIETSVPIATMLAEENENIKCAIIDEFPTADRYEAEVTPLN